MKRFFSFLINTVLTLVCCAAIFSIGYIVITSSDAAQWKNTEAVELSDRGSPYKFYFDRLSNIEKHAYNEILSNIYSMPEEIEIPAITANQLDNVFSALLYDNPDLFFVGRKCGLYSRYLKTYCSVEYIISREEYSVQLEKFNEASQKVISSLSDPDDEWQTELEIHDFIVENCRYELVEDELVYSSSYGVIVNGLAACEGYSKAAKHLLDLAGIESGILSGISANFDGDEGPHMWNAVKIEGEFYYLDCTWDDPVNNADKNVKVYSYFNVNTDMISETHSDFSYDFNCTATEANYYVRTGRYFDYFDRSCEDRIAELISKDVDSGFDNVQIRFSDKELYEYAVEEMIENGRIYGILFDADKMSDKKIYNKSITYFKDESQNILTIVPEQG